MGESVRRGAGRGSPGQVTSGKEKCLEGVILLERRDFVPFKI